MSVGCSTIVRPPAAPWRPSWSLLEKIETVERYRRSGSAIPVATRQDSRAKVLPLIPVLGRTAASVPQFWNNPGDPVDLGDQLSAAVAHLEKGERLAGTSRLLHAAASRPQKFALIQLGTPIEVADLSVAEVLQWRSLATRWPDAFALRVAGDSMAPMFQPDDLLILSPKQPARTGQPAVVQLKDQIGVTCKVYRRARKQVRLIPANETYPTTVHAADDVRWALRVLARARLTAGN